MRPKQIPLAAPAGATVGSAPAPAAKLPFAWPKPPQQSRLLSHEDYPALSRVKEVQQPPQPVSKSQRRKAQRKAKGPRDPHKRNATGQIRQPNDWQSYTRQRAAPICEECQAMFPVFGREFYNTGSRILFASPIAEQRLLYCLWAFEKHIRVRVLDRDRTSAKYLKFDQLVIHKILSMAFTLPARVLYTPRVNQVIMSCGCRYHLRCYQLRIAKHNRCLMHKRNYL